MSPLKIQHTNPSLTWICKYINIQDNSLLSEVTCFAPGTCSIASRYHVTSQIISLCTVHTQLYLFAHKQKYRHYTPQGNSPKHLNQVTCRLSPGLSIKKENLKNILAKGITLQHTRVQV